VTPPTDARPEARPRYVELPPSTALAPWVACYWSIRGDAAEPVPNRVLPDGCADVIVGIGGAARAMAVGTMRTAALVTLAGRVDLFGVRFRPGAALGVLDVPLRELTDGRAPLDALWGGAAGAVEDLAAHATTAERAAHVERVLAQRLRAWRATADEALAARAVALLRQARAAWGCATSRRRSASASAGSSGRSTAPWGWGRKRSRACCASAARCAGSSARIRRACRRGRRSRTPRATPTSRTSSASSARSPASRARIMRTARRKRITRASVFGP